jgi:hypothetical protein
MRSFEVEIEYVDGADQHAFFVVRAESAEIASQLARLDAENIDEVEAVIAVRPL